MQQLAALRLVFDQRNNIYCATQLCMSGSKSELSASARSFCLHEHPLTDYLQRCGLASRLSILVPAASK